MKSFAVVSFEAIIVGIILLGLVYGLRYASSALDLKVDDFVIIFISGVVFHLVFEYTGLNKKYVDSYYK